MNNSVAINSIEIIKHAINENVSVSEAAVLLGKNRNYISDFFRRPPSSLSAQELNMVQGLYQKYKLSYSPHGNTDRSVNYIKSEPKRYHMNNGDHTEILADDDLTLDIDMDFLNRDSRSYKKDDLNFSHINIVSDQEKEEMSYDAFNDRNYDSQKSFGSAMRNESGKITHYVYNIHIKNEPGLFGELSRDEMNKIYSLYSSMEGAGMSIKNVFKEFKHLTFRDFKRIVRVFNITKDSTPVAPHIIEEHSASDVAHLILKNKENNILNTIETEKGRYYEKSLGDAYKTISDLRSNETWVEDIIKKYVESGENKMRSLCIAPNNLKVKSTLSPSVCIFGDIHYGKKFEGAMYGRGYNKHIAHERVMQIADCLIKDHKHRGNKEITMIMMGDILESVLEDGMHANHSSEMDLFQEEQLFYAVDSLKTMFLKILAETKAKICVSAICGNHDRIGLERDDDKNRTAGRIVHIILKRELECERLEFEVPKNNLIRVQKDKLLIFGQHGDSKLSKKKPSELVNLFGEPGCFSLLLQGHWHSLRSEEGTNYLALKVPSVTSTDKFIMEELGNNNLPGFILGHQPDNCYGFDYKKITLY